jgi:hypothetical protein
MQSGALEQGTKQRSGRGGRGGGQEGEQEEKEEKALEEEVDEAAHVILHFFDANSMHVEHVVPAVLYLAYKHGGTAEDARKALSICSSLPGEGAVRCARVA